MLCQPLNPLFTLLIHACTIVLPMQIASPHMHTQLYGCCLAALCSDVLSMLFCRLEASLLYKPVKLKFSRYSSYSLPTAPSFSSGL